MAQKKVVLVTGVSGFWGARLANRLLSGVGGNGDQARGGRRMPGIHLIGLDSRPPEPEIQGLDFIQADLRNPLLGELLHEERVHTVVHLAFQESSHANEASFDYNVVGTMKVLGACAEAQVSKVILKSSTCVYGALPGNPLFLKEDGPLQGNQAHGTARDLVEIEAFCNGFRRQVPGMVLTTLRFAQIIGPDADTPMSRLLKEPWAPVLLGFDPMMQVIHERDVIEALVHSIFQEAPGVYNVAAEGVLPLARLMALAGKLPPPVFHPLAYLGEAVLGKNARYLNQFVPIALDYLRYPCVGDLARMRSELNFTPRYTAEEALREFAGHQRLRRYMPESAAIEYDRERLRDTIERRRRMRRLQKSGKTARLEEE